MPKRNGRTRTQETGSDPCGLVIPKSKRTSTARTSSEIVFALQRPKQLLNQQRLRLNLLPLLAAITTTYVHPSTQASLAIGWPDCVLCKAKCRAFAI